MTQSPPATAGEASAATETAPEMLQRLGMDGQKWAVEFRKTAIELGYSDMDEGWLIGWFCNAIMAGYDTAERRHDSVETAQNDEPWPLDIAPRDGTIIRLFIDYAEPAPWVPLEDSPTAWTIGFNNLENTTVDRWQIVGWSWSQDCFLDADVVPSRILGWLPFHDRQSLPTGGDQ